MQPIKEEYLLTGPLENTNKPYALAKIAGMEMCQSYNRQYKTKYLTVMPTNLYGPGDNYDLENSHVIPGLIRKFHEAKVNKIDKVFLWGTGKPKREFLYSDDLAEAIRIVLNTSNRKILKLSQNKFPILNIGSGDIYSIKDLAHLIKKKVRFKGNIFFDKTYPNGVAKKNLNYERIKSLNWRPKIDLNKGLEIILKHEKINL